VTQVERVSDDVYVFTSELYAQVTAGVIDTTEGAVVVDTLVYPSETLEIKKFVEGRLSSRVRYVINTHYHADHIYGTSLFPDAQVVAHSLCRDLLDTRGREGLRVAQSESSELAGVRIALPEIIFDSGELQMHLGEKTLVLQHLPGHSADVVTVLVEEERVLFASDTVMPVPFFADGDLDELVVSLESILKLAPQLTNMVQGHGPVILRGEIERCLKSRIKYLKSVRSVVRQALKRKYTKNALKKTDLESLGIDRAELGGIAADLHWRNLDSLYDKLVGVVKPYPSRRKPRKRRASMRR